MTDPAANALRDDAATFVELLHALMRTLRREAADSADAGGRGLTPGQVRLLRVLHRARGPLRAVDLANALDVAARSVTTKVDQAEADGYVRRLPDPTDRRARLVELTDAGRAALHEQWIGRRPGAAARLQRLAPGERAELLRLLGTLVADDGAGFAVASRCVGSAGVASSGTGPSETPTGMGPADKVSTDVPTAGAASTESASPVGTDG